jgi:hypothetical protein
MIYLYTRWKGWRDKKLITLEPLENMIEDWPDEVKEYCGMNDIIKVICKE